MTEKGRTAPSLYDHFVSAEGQMMSSDEKIGMALDRLSLIIERKSLGQENYDIKGSLELKVRTMEYQLLDLLEEGTWLNDRTGDSEPVEPDKVNKLAKQALKPLLDTATLVRDVDDVLPNSQEIFLVDDKDMRAKLGGSTAVDMTFIKDTLLESIKSGIDKINASERVTEPIKIKYGLRDFNDLFVDIGINKPREVHCKENGVVDMELPALARGLPFN